MATSQIKTGAILNYISLGIYNLVGLFYTPYMLAMMGKSEYGLYSIVASVIAYLTLMDLGLSDAVIRYSVKYRTEGRIVEQAKLFGMFIYIYVFIGTVVALLGLIMVFNVNTLFGATMTVEELYKARIMLLLMSFNLALSFYFCIYGSIIVAYERFVFQKLLQILRIVLNTLVMICLLHYGYRAISMIITQTVVNILIIGLNIYYCRQKLNIQIIFGHIDWGKLKNIISFSFWVFFFIIIERVYWSSGQFILGITMGTASVAVFSVAITLEHMYMGMSNSISSVLLPRITAVSTQNNSEKSLSDLFITVGRIQYSILIFIFIGFIIFGKPFLRVWAGNGYDETYIVTIILFFAHTIPLIQSSGISILKARGQLKTSAIILAVCSIGCLFLEYILSVHLGATGCAMGIALSMIIGQVVLLNIYYARKQNIDIKRFWKEIIQLSAVPLIFLILGIEITSVIKIDTLYMLCCSIVLFSIIYVPVYYKFSMNNWERNLLKSVLHRF